MQGKKICHITLLNPAAHSRIFYKEALSQMEAGFSVSIVGQDAAETPYDKQGIRVVPMPAVGRKLRERIAARKLILERALAEKADLYQIHTPELLAIAKKLKEQLPKAKFVYDMHEDYAKNFRHGGYMGGTPRSALARWVRQREKRFLKWGDGVIYAEECFHDLLEAGDKGIVIRNKFRKPEGIAKLKPAEADAPTEVGGSPEANEAPGGGMPSGERAGSIEVAGAAPPTADIQQNRVSEAQTRTQKRKAEKQKEANHPILLYTGTIAPQWGLLTTLELWSAMNEFTPVHLVVAGHTHNKRTVAALEKFVAISGIKERFTLDGGNDYVPYERIVDWIEKCAMGTAFYEVRENIRERIPTKFYEFMACRKPLFVSKNPVWDGMVDRLGFGVSLELPLREEVLEHAAEMITKPESHFYLKPLTAEDYSWETERERLISFEKKILQA